MTEEINNQLLVAAASGDIKTVQECLQKGANLEATDAHNVTPLLYAVYNDQKEIVKILLEAGADLTARDCFNFKGYNPIHWCAKYGKVEMLKILLTNPRKQQIHVRNLNNELPIDLAANDEIRNLLLESMEQEKKFIQQPISIQTSQQNIPYQQPIQQPIQNTMYQHLLPQNVQYNSQQPIQQQQPCCKKRKVFRGILLGLLLLFPIINFLWSPYGYPWFIIPWGIAILVGGIRCIRKHAETMEEKKFKLHKLVYLVINGFFIISNFYFGGFPWAMYPAFIWGAFLGIHIIKYKKMKDSGFKIHLLIYLIVSALIFLTYCFATCSKVYPYTFAMEGYRKDTRMRHFGMHKGMQAYRGSLNNIVHPYSMQQSTTASTTQHCARTPFGFLLMLTPIVLWGIGVLYHYLKLKGKLNFSLNNSQPELPQQMPTQQIPIQQIPIENVNASLINNDVQAHLAQQNNTLYPQA